MLVVALTGGIGAGKSLVARYFAELGAVVISADDLARQAIERGTPGFDAVVALFGDEILKEGDIDRRALGDIVFKDAAKRKELESIIHPIVQAEFGSARKLISADEILIYEIPLLVETDAKDKFDLVITVEAPVVEREKRLLNRGLLASQISARINAQADEQTRRDLADIVIENTGDTGQLLAVVEKIWESELQPRK
ncbi:MAG: hypothetical protein RLZ57_299 [Actinomycetota bacterium]|jgi:dephospho-CoA kinase